MKMFTLARLTHSLVFLSILSLMPLINILTQDVLNNNIRVLHKLQSTLKHSTSQYLSLKLGKVRYKRK